MVGGRSYGSSQYNRVTQARRQPGSTFKPFVYLAAFEAFFDDPALPPITPATVVEDAPAVFFYEDKEYIPQNYEDKYFGYVTLRTALAHSLNVATVKVAEMVGYDRVANLWSKQLRIGAPIKPYPAMALGSFEATPYEMATAYNVLANGGLKIEPLTVLSVADEKGKALEQHDPKPPERVVHEASAYLVTSMLRSVINEGTAAAARAWDFRPDAAGKTGTTNDQRDAWFAGYTPDLLCVVWVGFDDNTPIGFSGARVALPIWVEFMKGALAGTKTRSFAVPGGARGLRGRRPRLGPAPGPRHEPRAVRGLHRGHRASRGRIIALAQRSQPGGTLALRASSSRLARAFSAPSSDFFAAAVRPWSCSIVVITGRSFSSTRISPGTMV